MLNVLTKTEATELPDAQKWVDTFNIDLRNQTEASHQRYDEAHKFMEELYAEEMCDFLSDHDNISPDIRDTFAILRQVSEIKLALDLEDDNTRFLDAFRKLITFIKPPLSTQPFATSANIAMATNMALSYVAVRTDEGNVYMLAQPQAQEMLAHRLRENADFIAVRAGTKEAEAVEYIQYFAQEAFEMYVGAAEGYSFFKKDKAHKSSLKGAFEAANIYKLETDPDFRKQVKKSLGIEMKG